MNGRRRQRGAPHFGKRLLAVLGTLALVAGSNHSARAAQTSDRQSAGQVNSHGCDGAEAFFTVPTERAERWVPAQFRDRLVKTPDIAASGAPTRGLTEMFIRAYRCERQTVNGRETRDTTTVIFGPLLSGSRGRIMFFTNFYYSDNRDLITWFKTGTGSDIFQYVPDLRYDFEAVTAPAPTIGDRAPVKTGLYEIGTDTRGRAFSWNGVAAPVQKFGYIDIVWWFQTASGSPAWFRNCIPSFWLSQATATIRPTPGSQLDTILGPFVATGAHIVSWFALQRTTWRLDSTIPDPDGDPDHDCPR